MADTESDTAASEQRSFWNWRVYAFAGVLFLGRLPALASLETGAALAGGIFGAAIGSAFVAGMLKAIYMVVKMVALAVVRSTKARL